MDKINTLTILTSIEVKPIGADDSEYKFKENIKVKYKLTSDVNYYYLDSYLLENGVEVKGRFKDEHNKCKASTSDDSETIIHKRMNLLKDYLEKEGMTIING